MEVGIERLTALAFIITGLSHLAAPRAWIRFFVNMRERGEAGGILNAYLHIPLGLLIVAFHWVWTWPEIVVTLIGCALTLKGALYFVWPGLALRSMARLDEQHALRFQIAGLFAVLLGLAAGCISLQST
jgi:uncharacterized protein YjeT (DUF2065 family)